MVWEKLTQESLNALKKPGIRILVVNPDSYEYPYDIISFTDLEGCGLTEEQMLHHWSSLIMMDFVNCHEYCDDDILLLHTFSHFYVLQTPKELERSTIQLRSDKPTGI